MSTEVSFAEETSKEMLKEIQTWWEIPSTAQYISLFRESFQLPEIEIEDLENGLIEDTIKGPSKWLKDLVYAFLRSILPGRVNPENWESQLRKLVSRKWPEGKVNTFTEDKAFHELNIRAKAEIVYSLCLYRLDRNDITDVMKSMDADALRVQKLGSDDAGNTYWYFYGTRLYKEEAVEEKKTWNEEWKKQKKKSLETPKKRGRGRPRKVKVVNSEGESDEFDDVDKKNDGYMNVNEKSRWSVVCDTLEEWVNFAEKFKNSKSKEEKALFQIIQESFLPTLNKIYEEKEKKLQQKIKELMPVREKIVTRRETRKMRGETFESPVNGYEISDEAHKEHMIKDRARRLEERNKRASEGGSIQIISHKKAKSDRNVPEVNGDVDGENRMTPLQKSDEKNMDLQCQVERLLSSVKLHKDAWPFLYPVNEEDAPAYYDIIKEPVDLSMIESRLFSGTYDTVGDLDADFDKMVANCELYNGEYHTYSTMARTLRKIFRKGMTKILETFQPESESPADSEGSCDSNYQSSSSSSSPPAKVSDTSPKHHKKPREKKKKKTVSEVLELLAQASDIAVQNSNSNDMLSVTNMSDEGKKSNEFPNLKILPIHSHPPSRIEKLSPNASKDSPGETYHSYENESTYGNQSLNINGQCVRSSPTSSISNEQYIDSCSSVADVNGHFVRSSPPNVVGSSQYLRLSPSNVENNEQNVGLSPTNLDSNDSGQYVRTSPVNAVIPVPSETINYLNNLTQFSNFTEKNGCKNLNVLSNTDVSNALSDSSSSHALNTASGNDSPVVSKIIIPESLHSLDKILDEYNDSVISHFMKQPICTSAAMLQNKACIPSTYADTFPYQNVDNTKRKSPPASNDLSHMVAGNLPLAQNMNMHSVVENSNSNLTTIDASVLGIKYNPPAKKPKSLNVSQKQDSNASSDPKSLPDIGLTNKSISYGSNERTSPNELNQYYQPSNLNTDQTGNIPMSYQPMNLDPHPSGQTSFVQTLASNSSSNIPAQQLPLYPRPILQQQQPRSQLQPQQVNSEVRVVVPEHNPPLMIVSEANKGPVTTYHLYSQSNPNLNVVSNQSGYHPSMSTSSVQMSQRANKRKIENQNNSVQSSPPPQKSPPVQQVQTLPQPVPSTNLPYHPVSATSINTSKVSLPVTSSNFVPVNPSVQNAKKQRPLFVKISVPNVQKETTSVESATSYNTVYSTSNSNTLPQSSFQTLCTNTLPGVFTGYNQSSNQTDFRFKNSPTVSVQSNGVPVVQKVLISQPIQVSNNGQYMIASPQNTVRFLTKEHGNMMQIQNNVQMQNNGRPVDQNFSKGMPQLVAPSSLMQGYQLQAVTTSNAQGFTQVSQSPQYVSIPTYVLSNQNAMQTNPQTTASHMMNLQPFQLAQRQMHISNQGNT